MESSFLYDNGVLWLTGFSNSLISNSEEHVRRALLASSDRVLGVGVGVFVLVLFL